MAAGVENFGDYLTPGFTEVYNDEWETVSEKNNAITALTTPIDHEKAYYKMTGATGFGDIPQFQGKIEYDTFYQKYDRALYFDEWASGFQVTKKLYDDAEYELFADKPAGLASSVQYKLEEFLLNIFVDGFTYEATDGDGAELFASDHPSAGGGSAQGNEGTSALSTTSLEATRILMKKFVDSRGHRIVMNPDMIIVPLDLEETGFTLINSKGLVNSAENNVNFHYGRYKMYVWPRLTDTNNWFMVDSKMMKKYLKFIYRVRPQFNHDKDFNTLVQSWSVYFRVNCGQNEWRWGYGHKV